MNAALNFSKSRQDTRVKDIVPITAGFCFPGNNAIIDKITFQIIMTEGRSPKPKVIQDLERHLEVLDMVGDCFNLIMFVHGSIMKVCSFREEKRTKKWLSRSLPIRRAFFHHQAYHNFCVHFLTFNEAIRGACHFLSNLSPHVSIVM